MALLARQEQAGKEQKLSSSISVYRLPAGDVDKIIGVSSSLKIWIKGVCLPTSLTGVPFIFGF